MNIKFHNSLKGEAKAVYIFFRSRNAIKNWFLIPNISGKLKKEIRTSGFDSVRKGLEKELRPFHEKYGDLIKKRAEKVKSEFNPPELNHKDLSCFLCMSIPNGMFNSRENEIYVTLNRPIEEIKFIILHETLHIVFWNETKDMNFEEREGFIKGKLKLLKGL